MNFGALGAQDKRGMQSVDDILQALKKQLKQEKDVEKLKKTLAAKVKFVVNPNQELSSKQAIWAQINAFAEIHPGLFSDESVQGMLWELLRTSAQVVDIRGAGPGKATSTAGHKSGRETAIRAIEAIYMSLKHQPTWDLTLLDLYLDDALGARWWVDASACKVTLTLILTLTLTLPLRWFISEIYHSICWSTVVPT